MPLGLKALLAKSAVVSPFTRPVAVNPLIVYSKWAYAFLNSPLITPFIQVHITFSLDGGTTWVQLGDGTNSKANMEVLRGYVLGTTPLPGDETTLAGLVIDGAYVDTRFETCTFYPNDSILAYIEPVKIYASEVDYTGDPCAFTGLCVNQNCLPIQGAGFGENIVRSLIMTEAYMQQPFYTGMDLRIREITNGTDVFTAIDKNAKYYRYYIQHNVPRFNNPSGTFDNDQYLLEIVAEAELTDFENFMGLWLANSNSSCVGLETFECPTVKEGLCDTPVNPGNVYEP
jgi:hypothetical protein